MFEVIEAELVNEGQERKRAKRASNSRSLAPLEGKRSDKRAERSPNGYALDLSRALKMRLQGLTNAEIAAALNVSENTIRDRLSFFDFIQTQGEEINACVDNELEVLDLIRSLAAKALISQLTDPERAKKLDVMRLNVLFGTIFDKMRLIRGQSTQNIAALSKLVYDAHAKRAGQSPDSDE